MGKPFQNELQITKQTYESLNIDQSIVVKEFLFEEPRTNVIVVGSGGSFSAAQLLTSLCQRKGLFANSMTPYELMNSTELINDSKVIFISASGSNKDIILAYERCIENSPRGVLNIIMSRGSLLSEKSKSHNLTLNIEQELLSGKDGFLATNSLVAYFGLFLDAFYPNFQNQFDSGEIFERDYSSKFVREFLKLDDFCVLHGVLTKSIAVDIESKFNEAALGSVAISDFRNFGHGRHHWFAKRSDSSVLIVLITEEDEKIALKTIGKLPSSVKQIRLESFQSSPIAILDLLYQSFQLANEVGKVRKIDPGRPQVPKFGRELYNLSYKSLLPPYSMEKVERLAILKKINSSSQFQTSPVLTFWRTSLHSFHSRLKKAKFGVLALDYDGTLCGIKNRFHGLSNEVSLELNKILENGFIVCVVTGRGRSVRLDLQKTISKQHWRNVVIGYYNGAQIGFLDNQELPDTQSDPDKKLQRLYDELSGWKELSNKVELTLRPFQLTIESDGDSKWSEVRSSLINLLRSRHTAELKITESSHSFDIIPSYVSKLNVIEFCQELAKKKGLADEVLAIGDKGKWPGNDSELLSYPYSLSVDQVSESPDSCWNIAPPGIKNEHATLYYFSRLHYLNRYMKYKI